MSPLPVADPWGKEGVGGGKGLCLPPLFCNKNVIKNYHQTPRFVRHVSCPHLSEISGSRPPPLLYFRYPLSLSHYFLKILALVDNLEMLHFGNSTKDTSGGKYNSR